MPVTGMGREVRAGESIRLQCRPDKVSAVERVCFRGEAKMNRNSWIIDRGGGTVRIGATLKN